MYLKHLRYPLLPFRIRNYHMLFVEDPINRTVYSFNLLNKATYFLDVILTISCIFHHIKHTLCIHVCQHKSGIFSVLHCLSMQD